MRIKRLSSIMRILGVLMIVSIIPLCAFASENNSSSHMSDVRFGPVGNVTAENFDSVHSSILDLISKQISELQNFKVSGNEKAADLDISDSLLRDLVNAMKSLYVTD
jgi:hypothetical protein